MFNDYKINLTLSGHNGSPTSEKNVGNTPTVIMTDRGIKMDNHFGVISAAKTPGSNEPKFVRYLENI